MPSSAGAPSLVRPARRALPLGTAHRVFERDGVRVILDDYSAENMIGSTIDFSTELIKQAFKVVGNPKAQKGCGCGSSFDMKET